MRKTTLSRSLAVAALPLVGLAFVACDGDGSDPTSPTAGVAAIRATTSFGMCLGYCRSALEITAERTTYRLFDDRTGLPPLERAVATSAAQWDALRSAVSRDEIESLPSVIGCPDCADGGAESIEVLAATWSDSVTFEFRADVPSLQPLLDQVRDIRDQHDGELRPH